MTSKSKLLRDIAVSEVTAKLEAWKAALLDRMLRHWDPAWGMPTLVMGPAKGFSISVLGLAQAAGKHGVPLVLASEHLGPDNWPLLPEGPYPLPDKDQLSTWRNLGLRGCAPTPQL